MNEIAKSIRVGTVNFFGVVVPGFLLIFIIYIGFILPMVSIITYANPVSSTEKIIERTTKYDQQGKKKETHEKISVTENPSALKRLSSGYPFIDIVVLVVLSYVLGYILRLSSPDELDRISATKVLKEERKWQIRKTLLKLHEKLRKEKIKKYNQRLTFRS